MNIPKAIEILEAHVKWCDPVKEVDTYNALKLGIEALKWREKQKDYGYLDLDDLLPGETEESSESAQEINPEETTN